MAAQSSRTVPSKVDRCAWAPLLVLAVAAAWMVPATHAEPSAAAQKIQTERRGVEARQQAGEARAARPATVAEEAPAPPKPDWPVNNPPAPASVVLNSRGLRIDAMNSSLLQILKQVCKETGAQIEGLNADQRVFGVYGPGQPREIITQLLEGTGYNLVMLGAPGNGTPLQIVLSKRAKGGAEPNAPVSRSDIVAPPVYRPPVVHPQPKQPQQPQQPPRTPQQILQEMRQRQMQLREQQMRLQQMHQQNNQQQ